MAERKGTGKETRKEKTFLQAAHSSNPPLTTRSLLSPTPTATFSVGPAQVHLASRDLARAHPMRQVSQRTALPVELWPTVCAE